MLLANFTSLRCALVCYESALHLPVAARPSNVIKIYGFNCGFIEHDVRSSTTTLAGTQSETPSEVGKEHPRAYLLLVTP
jgi:hypothetical protein